MYALQTYFLIIVILNVIDRYLKRCQPSVIGIEKRNCLSAKLFSQIVVSLPVVNKKEILQLDGNRAEKSLRKIILKHQKSR